MRNTERLREARMSLTCAVTRSQAARSEADPEGRATAEHALAADLRLRRGGREDLACRVAAATDGDVTTAAARTEWREVIQKIDAELEPAVAGSPFRAASDGGNYIDPETCSNCGAETNKFVRECENCGHDRWAASDGGEQL